MKKSIRYDWTDFEAEVDLGNTDDREGVYFLTIREDCEEMAVIIHRTYGDAYPLDGISSERKRMNAQRIVDALNQYAAKEEEEK